MMKWMWSVLVNFYELAIHLLCYPCSGVLQLLWFYFDFDKSSRTEGRGLGKALDHVTDSFISSWKEFLFGNRIPQEKGNFFPPNECRMRTFSGRFYFFVVERSRLFSESYRHVIEHIEFSVQLVRRCPTAVFEFIIKWFVISSLSFPLGIC